MLSSISWQQYFAALLILSAAYYLYVGLRYYPLEIKAFLLRTKAKPATSATVPAFPFDIMGKAKPGEGTMLTDCAQMDFDAPLPDEPAVNFVERVARPQPVVEPHVKLLKDAGDLVTAFHGVDDRQEFLTLMRTIVQPYEQDELGIDLQACWKQIVGMARHNLSFPLEITDLEEHLLIIPPSH